MRIHKHQGGENTIIPQNHIPRCRGFSLRLTGVGKYMKKAMILSPASLSLMVKLNTLRLSCHRNRSWSEANNTGKKAGQSWSHILICKGFTTVHLSPHILDSPVYSLSTASPDKPRVGPGGPPLVQREICTESTNSGTFLLTEPKDTLGGLRWIYSSHFTHWIVSPTAAPSTLTSIRISTGPLPWAHSGCLTKSIAHALPVETEHLVQVLLPVFIQLQPQVPNLQQLRKLRFHRR